MSLETRLLALVQAIGADVKALFSRAVPTGGTVGQVLAKTGPGSTEFGWSNPSGGGAAAETFDQSRWVCNDFTGGATATMVAPLAFTAASSGTLAAASGVAAPQHGAIAIRDSTTANGGGQIENGMALFTGAGYAIRCIFRTPGIATATARIGCSNSIATSLANNFAFVEIVGLTATCRARRNVASDPEVVDPSPVNLTANTDYVLDIDWLSATEVRFVIWEQATSTVVKSFTATTAAWPNPSASGIRVGARATESTTSAATDILVIDYLGYGPARPASCPVPAA